MQLFFSPNIKVSDTRFVFDKAESKHIAKVLRKQFGDTLYITDGNGTIFTTKISVADSRHCEIEILSKELVLKRPYNLHIAIAPTKMNDRFEWFLEKATEIGIEEITPLICNHSERKVVKLERMEKIIKSAMKQSLSPYLPKLNPPISFGDFISQNHQGQLFIAHCEETQKTALKEELEKNQDCLILIGPEGDFSVKEIQSAREHHFIPVTLGNTRLRTETAGVVACHSVAFINE